MGRVIELPWGGGRLTAALPDSWDVLGELRPKKVQTLADVGGACAEALRSPIASAPLSQRDLRGRRVVLVVDDHSRPTPVSEFIGPVLSELAAAGAEDDRIEILVATGVHRETRPDEVARKIGGNVSARFSWRCHDAYDPEGLADLGTTSRGTRVFLNRRLAEADLIVCLGALEPHLLLGFGGGLKMIIPGCAGAETIGLNHMQGVNPDHFDFVGTPGDASPMRSDLEEGARMLNRDIFLVNAAMNEDARPVRFFCGDPVAAHRAGERYVADLVRLDIPRPADVVLTNSYPMDLDLRQSIKCVGNSLYACKPGGIMLGCVRCEQGLGEMPLAAKTLPYPVMRGVLKVIGKHRILPLVKKAKAGEPVEEIFVGHFGLQMLRRNHLAIFSDSPALPENVGRKMGLARSFSHIQDMISWAEARAPRTATVWVFPCGGATYAPRSEAPFGVG